MDYGKHIGQELSVVVIEKRSSLAYVEAVLTAHEQGRVVLPLDLEAEVPAGFRVIDRIAIAPGGGWFSRSVPPRYDNALAQIALTSGTTGTAKAILLSHANFGDVTVRLIDAMGLDASIREYVGVPVTYSFGFGRIRAIAAVGGAAFLPSRGFRVDELASMLEGGKVNALSAVPTLLRLVLGQESRLREAGKQLKWLEIGSQSMSVDEKRAIRSLFPNARITQHYGLTEASRSTFLDISSVDDEALESVGLPNGAAEVRVDDTGRIAIRGPHVAYGVMTAEGPKPLVGNDDWLVTNDLGRLTDNGLIFNGRADHLINVGGVKVSSEQFEERLLAELGPNAAVTIASAADPLRGQMVLIAYAANDSSSDVGQLHAAAAQVAAEMGIGDGFVLFPVETIPRTATGKVQRHKISTLYETADRQSASKALTTAEIETDSPGEGVVACFVALFGEAGREESANFHALGGDSLHYISMLTGLERFIPDLPEDWDNMSVASLRMLAVAHSSSSVRPSAQRRELPRSLDSIRGLACILIVALHVVGVSANEGLKLPLSSPWHSTMSFLNLVRLPLFTALSGFLYGAMPAIKPGFRTFMARKLRQLLIPLMFATLVFWVLRNIVQPRGDSLIWAYVWGYQHLWFIDALLLIFALIAAVDTLSPAKARTWIVALVMITAIVTYPMIPSVPVLHIKNAVFLLPFFTLGVILFRVPLLLRSQAVLVFAAIMAVALLASEQLMPGPDGLFATVKWLPWLCGGSVVIVLLRLFPKVVWLEWIAAYSFTIYLWHPAANGAVRTAMMKVGVHATWLLFLVGLAVGVLLPIAMHITALRLPKALRMPLIGR